VASLRPGRCWAWGPAAAGRRTVLSWRPGLPDLTSHRLLSGATATMW